MCTTEIKALRDLLAREDITAEEQHAQVLVIIKQTGGWKPEDGDTVCQLCGGENPCWFAPNDLWNKVMGGEPGILCPTCFLVKAAAIRPETVWQINAERS
jgi:hypothetical protein